MHPLEPLDSFDFDDNRTFDQEVYPVPTIQSVWPSIYEWECLLAFD